jgi:hypothetical protein
VQRPNMRFVPPRTPGRQAVLPLHHARRLPGPGTPPGLLGREGTVIAR